MKKRILSICLLTLLLISVCVPNAIASNESYEDQKETVLSETIVDPVISDELKTALTESDPQSAVSYNSTTGELQFSLQGVSAVECNELDPLDVHDIEFYTTLMESIETYNYILDGLDSEAYSISSKNDENYNEYYGGAYIDEETGELVVLVTELTPIVENGICTFAGGNRNVRYQLCDVSYAEIEEAINTINSHVIDLYDCGVRIMTVSDDILNGHVIVGVSDLDQEKEAMIRKVANYDFLVFEDSEGVALEGSYEAGCEIKSVKEDDVYGSKNGTSTLGFAATKDGKDGFVMAAHAGWAFNQRIEASNTLLGRVTSSTFRGSSTTADASFVEAEKGVLVTSGVDGTVFGNATTYELPLNTPVFMRGSQSKWTSGKIDKLDYSYSTIYNGNIFMQVTNTLGATYSSQGGDSGAPVLLFGGTQGGTTYYSLVGIHTGRREGNAGAFFSTYNNIVAELGVSYR